MTNTHPDKPDQGQGDLFAEDLNLPQPAAAPRGAPADDSTAEQLPVIMGLASRPLTRMTLPYKDRGERTIAVRNGGQVLRITALGDRGLPFGKYPRLLLLWLTEKAREQSRLYGPADPRRYTIDLGDSEYWLATQVGISVGGSQFEQIKEQMIRLASTSFHLSSEGELDDGDTGYVMVKNIAAAEEMELYWSKKGKRIKKGEKTLLPSYMQLSQSFFDLLVQNAFPYNKQILNHVQASPMAIDVYLWLTQSLAGMHYSKQPVRTVRMDAFMGQLGTRYDPSNAGDRRDFRRKLNKALNLLREAWPSIRVSVTPTALVIHRTPPSVPMKTPQQRP